METGGLCVMMNGQPLMPMLLADSLGTLAHVSVAMPILLCMLRIKHNYIVIFCRCNCL